MVTPKESQPVVLTHLYLDQEHLVPACSPEPIRNASEDDFKGVPRMLCPGCALYLSKGMTETTYSWALRSIEALTRALEQIRLNDLNGFHTLAQVLEYHLATIEAIVRDLDRVDRLIRSTAEQRQTAEIPE